MYARLDDELFDHPKILSAGAQLGKNGPALALAMYAAGLLYANRQLTDGFLDTAVLRHFPHFEDPLKVAEALARVGLFEKVDGGFRVHDFHQHNPSAVAVKARRKKERERVQARRAQLAAERES